MARMANRAARDLRGAANAARRTATDLNVAARNANNAGHGFRNLGNQATYAEHGKIQPRKHSRLAQTQCDSYPSQQSNSE